MKNQKLSLLIIVCSLLSITYGYAQVVLREQGIVMPTYTSAPPDRNPIFFRNEAYQGASKHVYPLKLNDQYTNERVEEEWRTLVLENEYIEIGIMPDIGGKLYYATDKTNNYNFVYRNNVVKPINIGMTGAWVSGGIEWCVLHHHRASTFLPIDHTTTENPDGSKTVWVAEYEPRHGMRWTVGVTVFPGKSYFKAEVRIHNSSPHTHTFLYWANVAAHTNENYRTIFPPSAQVVTFHSKTDFTEWPYSFTKYTGTEYGGADISWWKNVVNCNSFFVHNLKEDFMGGYDYGTNSGTVHFGNHNVVKGAKLWEWGSGESGQATEAMLTEDDGPYVELMVGAYNDNQPDYSWIRPYEVKQWEHYWYPVRGIQGFKNANLNGAVNLEPRNERNRHNVFLGYYSTSKVEDAKVILTNNGRTVFEKNISISPDKPFAETIRLTGAYQMTELHTQLIDNATGNVLIEYRPIEQEKVELPENWGDYTPVNELETVEELYLTGQRIEQFYAPRYDPMDWYMAALEIDPGDVRTNIAVGNRLLKNGDYTAARAYLSKAIKRLTNDYTIPSSLEALYLQGLTLRSLGLLEHAEDTLYRATWDYAWHSAAYFQLAELSCAKNDFTKALHQINESLWTNARNNSAIALKASIQRRMGNFDGARATLAVIADADPLDFRLRNEYYLIEKEAGNTQKANEILASLNREMRGFDDNYLSLATGYLNNGLLKEAEEIFKRFEGNNPFFNYYLGYIYDKNGDEEQALRHFKAAAAQPVDFIFPHRLGSIDVLNTALKYNPTDGQAYYFIGNILFDKQPERAIRNWENAVEQNPELSIAYRNIGWGYFYHYNDIQKAISYYEKAISINKNDAMYYNELSELYDRNNTPIATRLKLFEGSDIEVVKKRDDALMWLIENLLLSGQAEKAVELLDGVDFVFREGSSRSRDVRINGYLMLGKQYYDNKEYQKALDYFLKSQVFREEAAEERLGERELQINYFIGLAYKALGNRAKANEFFRKSVQETPRNINVMSYYQGLSHAELGNNAQAKIIFDALISQASEQLERTAISEVVIFGRNETESERRSRLHTMRGLGYKGIGELQKANDDLQKAVELSQSNLWAVAEK